MLNTQLTTERMAASLRSSRQPPTRSARSSSGMQQREIGHLELPVGVGEGDVAPAGWRAARRRRWPRSRSCARGARRAAPRPARRPALVAVSPVPSVLPSSTITTSYRSARAGRVVARCGSNQRMFSTSLCAGSTRLSSGRRWSPHRPRDRGGEPDHRERHRGGRARSEASAVMPAAGREPRWPSTQTTASSGPVAATRR